jgi:neutral ceramidase
VPLELQRRNNANIYRSPFVYLLNPTEQEERELYTDDGNTDKAMLLLKKTNHIQWRKRSAISKKDGGILGVWNWCPLHGTFINSTNELISGDKKGYASYLIEKTFKATGTLPGKGDIVASTILGDVSPNTSGPRCMDTCYPCDGSCDTR